ncbi:hypothetical protein JX265_008664 [Neoarthrinium moseri]|uniref:Protein phosphatase n=1 Tax=Neoarthrinium moseri TaxID=1658444 RepID=A0A9P9WHQ5_9PEZI|nr:hypothetical protein JX265_008664 [Neoarthrinium moseri]
MATTLPRLVLPRKRLSDQLVSYRPFLALFRPAAPPSSSLHHTRAFSAAHADMPSQDTQPPPARKFTYHAAASYASKHKRLNPNSDLFHFNPYNRIQPQIKRPKSKRPASGQDAFFIARVGDTNAVALGVADGVGGWEESGVDPADFSHSFCDYMALAAYEHKPGVSPLLKARALMQKGYDDVCSDKSIPAGGSTACVAIASEDGKLEIANLGDSGFIQLRLNAVNSYTEPQTHAFNTPYQLSVVPESMLARAAAFGGAQLCDYPKDADVTTYNLKHGDILVFASDGLWDNVFNQDILKIASRIMTTCGAWKSSDGGIRVIDNLAPFTQADDSAQRPMTLQGAIALEIALTAKALSLNQRIDGPFAKEVQKYYPQEDWHGGKVDDICVVVVVVSEEGKPQAVKAKL